MASHIRTPGQQWMNECSVFCLMSARIFDGRSQWATLKEHASGLAGLPDADKPGPRSGNGTAACK